MNEHEGIKLLTADLTRRRFLQGTALVGFSAFLAACGTSGTGTQAPPASAPGAASQSPAASPTRVGAPSPRRRRTRSNFANWPLYIDTDENDDTKHKTLEDFKAKYGTTVNYQEVINDNDEFFGTIRPALEGGQDTGWDIVVLTDWMAARLIRLGWVEQIDQANMPNKVANMQDVYKGVSFDPTNDHHAPWQSGMTGLGYDARSPATHSLDVALGARPALEGKVTFLTEMRDAVGLDDAQARQDPTKPTNGRRATRPSPRCRRRVDDGIVRAFRATTTPRTSACGNVRPGDGLVGRHRRRAGREDDRSSAPADEGGMFWTDNMLIPKGAPAQVHGGADDRLRATTRRSRPRSRPTSTT